MHIIPQPEVTHDILSLFDMDWPTMPRAFNVLEGVALGQIMVSDPAKPTWAVVREATYGSLYFGGKVNASVVEEVANHLLQHSDVGIGCWLEAPLNQMLPPNPDYDGFTLYFTERSRDIALPPLLQQLPPDYALVPRDEHLFAQSFDYDSTLASFGTVENVLRHTLGMVIVQGNTVVCEAATGTPTHGLIEVGVTTAKDHRQRGFATTACAKLIEMCEAQGYSTWWDCAKQNTPSVRLARRLGYQNEREYRYAWWKRS